MADQTDWVLMHLRVTRKFFNDLSEMTRDMDAHSQLEVIRCALRMLYHTRKLFAQGGLLLQEEGGVVGEIMPDYINSRGKRTSLSTGQELDLELSEEDKRFLKNLGIDLE